MQSRGQHARILKHDCQTRNEASVIKSQQKPTTYDEPRTNKENEKNVATRQCLPTSRCAPLKGSVDLFWREIIFMAQLHRIIPSEASPNDRLLENWEYLAPTKKLEP